MRWAYASHMSSRSSGAPAPVATGKVGRTGRPLVDARAFVASTDWSTAAQPRADDVGIETDDGRQLTDEAEILEWFAAPRDRT